MEPCFTIPYSEYESMLHIERYFKKGDGFSICVPVSRQQKGFDFVLMNSKNNKCLRMQVKGSRSYVPSASSAEKEGVFDFTFWFNNFCNSYTPNQADFYLLMGLYQDFRRGRNIKKSAIHWKSFVLAFSDVEMGAFLRKIRTKRTSRPDRFFYISFNDPSKLLVTRGHVDSPDVTNMLLQNRIQDIKNGLTN